MYQQERHDRPELSEGGLHALHMETLWHKRVKATLHQRCVKTDTM